jgi:hypothetical protein
MPQPDGMSLTSSPWSTRLLPRPLGATDHEQRLVVGERHAVRLPSMASDLRDEPVLVRGSGFEPAVAIHDLVHTLRASVGRRP